MLTDTAVRNAKPKEKLYKLSDAGALQLWVHPDGAKRWRYEYRFADKRKVLALGVYPGVSLKEARVARDDAKAILKEGRDPSEARKLAKQLGVSSLEATFDVLATELLDKKRREGKAERTLNKAQWLLRLATPAIGKLPVSEITAQEILAILRKIEARGNLETAKRLRETLGQVFRYAIATARATNDPTSALRGAIASPVVTHRAAIINAKPFGGLLRAIETYEGAQETKIALKLLALLFVRPGELRMAEWQEFDFEAATWTIPAMRMKMRRPHKVPIAPQTLALLLQLRPMTGDGRFLFPSIRTNAKSISENTLNGALRRLGFKQDEMTSHGFRSTASSLLNECGKWNSDAIEAQLAHQDADSVRRAYQRAQFWDERVKMMAWWADELDRMREVS